MNSREDWYSANKARIFPDFGSLESAEMSIDGLSPRKGEAYTDMRLTEVKSGNRSPRDGEDYIVVLTYETLGSAFVQVKDDTVNYIENGLRRVTRKSIAKAGTDFQKTVGTTSITSQIDGETAVTCILANYEVDDTDSYREVTEVYIEAGTLSETEDKVGSQLSIVKETFASTPSTPSGYSIASEQESNVDGIATKRFTFLKPNILSVQQEFNISRDRVSVEAFNKTSSEVTAALSEVTSGHKLISQQESNFAGIKTSSYVYELNSYDVIETSDNNLRTIQRELLLTAGTTYTETVGINFIDHQIDSETAVRCFLSSFSIEDTAEFRVVKEVYIQAGTLSVSESNESEGVVKVTTTFLVTEGTTVGPVIARSTGEFAGLKTISVTTLQDSSGQSIVHNGSNTVHQYNRMVDFTYPGVLSIGGDQLVDAGNAINLYNFNLEPPVQAQVESRLSVIFQTSADIVAGDFIFDDGDAGGAATELWNPTEWASTYMSGISWNYSPFSETKGLRGYRIDTTMNGVIEVETATGPHTFSHLGVVIFRAKSFLFLEKEIVTTAGSRKACINGVSGSGRETIVNGRRIFGDTPYRMEISGGPIDPVGVKFTLDVDLRPAFSDVDGNTYYKKTIITSTIPAQ